MSGQTHSQAFEAQLAQLRAELHRYCARMVGSTIDGEDIVQEALLRAHGALARGKSPPNLHAWVFRIAHNCAIDRLRTESLRKTESLDEVMDMADGQSASALDQLIGQEATAAALDRFMALPVLQRAVVILKDVLDHSNNEIAGLLGCSSVAVKSALHRGRARLCEPTSRTEAPPPRGVSEGLARYVALFNRRDWTALRAMLVDDVRLVQTARAERQGVDAVASIFFSGYQATRDWLLVPAWLEGREVAAVIDAGTGQLAYFTILTWRLGKVAMIRDFRHARYVLDGARVALVACADGLDSMHFAA